MPINRKGYIFSQKKKNELIREIQKLRVEKRSVKDQHSIDIYAKQIKELQAKLDKNAKVESAGWFANDPSRLRENRIYKPRSEWDFSLEPPESRHFWDPVINDSMIRLALGIGFGDSGSERGRINEKIDIFNNSLYPKIEETEESTPTIAKSTKPTTITPTKRAATTAKPNTNTSIVDYMNTLGIDSSRNNRTQIAKKLGFENYSGKAEENIALLEKVKNIEATKALLKTAMSRTSNGTDVPTTLETPAIKPEEIQKPTKFPKFLEGGRIHNYVEDPTKAIYDNNLMIDQALIQAAQETEGLKMLGSGLIGLGSQLPGAVGGFKKAFGKAEMKTGGKVPVEIEGQEVVETPQGQLFQVQGPSHEQGGIDMSLPEGTDVYSKRIQIDGKSMADRKLAREREEKKWAKRSKYDSVGKNTLGRIQAKNQMEEMFDMNIMQAAFNAKNGGQQDRVQAGTGVKGLNFKAGTSAPNMDSLAGYKVPVEPSIMPDFDTSEESLALANQITGNKVTAQTGLTEKEAKKVDAFRNTLGTEASDTQNLPQFPYTSGDLLGMLGNAYQAYTNKASANAEIATDQPNINPYEGFGEDALNANSEAMKYIGQMRDNALRDAALEANSAQKRGRGMSRSANTARAMDISISGNKNLADSKIQDAFAQQMMHLFGQKSQLENQQDAYTMQGREKQDTNDRMDKAARFATLRDADMSIGKAISGIGANMNTAKGRGATEKLINSMSMYGKYNSMTGELSFDTGGVDRMAEDGTWKNTVDATGKSPSTVAEFRIMAKKGKLTIKAK